MTEEAISAQVEYYRARAAEYDASIDQATELISLARPFIESAGRFERALELACGTGLWTALLADVASQVMAVDSAPEMLEVARTRLRGRAIELKQADIFDWEPGQYYDLVFCANWLTHVPPDRLDKFLGKATRAVVPGGHLMMVEQSTPSEEDKSIAQGSFALRPLEDGRVFTIVKAFHDPDDVARKLEGLGFTTQVHVMGQYFYLLQAVSTGELRPTKRGRGSRRS